MFAAGCIMVTVFLLALRGFQRVFAEGLPPSSEDDFILAECAAGLLSLSAGVIWLMFGNSVGVSLLEGYVWFENFYATITDPNNMTLPIGWGGE